MKKLLTLTVLVILMMNSGNILYGQTDDSKRDSKRLGYVMTEDWTNNFIPKWVINEAQPTTPTLANSFMIETNNMIQIAPSEYISFSERLRVYGYIGLYNLLDFKTEDATISFGNKGEGSLNFFSKGATINQNRMTILGHNGYVGIGTSNPTSLLEVAGSTKTQSLDATNIFSSSITTNLINSENSISNNMITETLKVTVNSSEGAVLTSDDMGNATWQLLPEMPEIPEQLWTKSSSNDDIYRLNGNVGIGTSNTSGYKLAVNGDIQAELIRIVADVPASDYVFEDDYELMSLYQLEQFVTDNKHLPEVKSAKEFEEEGYNIGEMDDVLLRKVEELTLYTIKQQKQIDEQNQLVEQLLEEINNLKKELKK